MKENPQKSEQAYEIVDVDMNKWCEKHRLEVKRVECPKCKNILKTTKPMILKDNEGFGLLAEKCIKCNHQSSMGVFKSTDKELNAICLKLAYACNPNLKNYLRKKRTIH